ncbi:MULTISPECIES: hypothetical protein [unclassified Lysinibacillus]|uniref:hypothetical protein n=1 Tax=unclassified Lysinibacillus TaxID=2636778 RepID=UPI0025561A34|nr:MULTISPECIES: hypothetical protein [unclassified Lysinibacillus]MDM5247523.1 hypothetical protein [Lysinibacillus sp. G4S2]
MGNRNNKNSKKTMNVRTHNPFGTYKSKDLDKSNSNNNNPNDNLNEEFAAEFDAKAKNKDNKTNHAKDQQSNKKK